MQNQIGVQSKISSSAVTPQTNSDIGYKDILFQLEQAIGADYQRLKELVQSGVVNQSQGQYLLAQLARKAQKLNAYKASVLSQGNIPSRQVSEQNPSTLSPELTPMDSFNQERPGFFDGEGRVDVLNYIKDLDMDKDEICQIAQLIEKLENSAVDKYLKKSEYEKTLNDENATAKSRLTAYAQNTTSDGKMDRFFTREDIGKMSGDEFAQNEKLIMQQLKQGMIK
jgi:hypothetical protein